MFANAVEVVSKSVLIRPIQFFSGSHLPNFEKSSQSADSPLCISDQPDEKKNNNSLETETTLSCCLLPGVVWPRFQEEVAAPTKGGSVQNLKPKPQLLPPQSTQFSYCCQALRENQVCAFTGILNCRLHCPYLLYFFLIIST